MQRNFLNNLGLGDWQRRLTALGLPQRQRDANRAGMVDLAKPGGLGHFKVLIQRKNVGEPELWGFQAQSKARELVEELPVPLLTPEHLSLLEGRYPPQELEFEVRDLWSLGEGAERE